LSVAKRKKKGSGHVNLRKGVYDEKSSGRLSTLTDEMLAKIENFVRENRRLTLNELHVLIPELSRSLIHEAISEKLGFHKLRAIRSKTVN